MVRRDFGIAAGVAALIHTILGLQVHMGGRLVRYFTLPSPSSSSGLAFVSTNYIGLAAAIVFLGLVAISNNCSIRMLGLDRWKRLQRFVYGAAIATVVHGLLYQLIEKRFAGAIGFVCIMSIGVLVLQLRGRNARRELKRS